MQHSPPVFGDNALTSGAAVCAGALVTFACYPLSLFLTPKLFKGYSALKKRNQKEWHTKLGHIAHALVSASLVAASLTQSSAFQEAAIPAPSAVPAPSVLNVVTPLSVATLSFSLGYFVADLVVMLCNRVCTPMLLHHIGGVLAILVALTTTECHFYGLLLLSTEITTPFICLRWYLDKAGRRATQLFLFNGVCIVMGWLSSRIFLIVYIFVHMWEHRGEILSMSLATQAAAPGIAVVLFALNLFWFKKILAGILQAVAGAKCSVRKET